MTDNKTAQEALKSIRKSGVHYGASLDGDLGLIADIQIIEKALTSQSDQQRVMEEMKVALEFYGNLDNWMETDTDDSPMLLDDGCKAQIALSSYAKIKGE